MRWLKLAKVEDELWYMVLLVPCSVYLDCQEGFIFGAISYGADIWLHEFS